MTSTLLQLCNAGAPVETRQCGSIGAAYLYATTPHMFAGASLAAFHRVRDAAKLDLYGCDCYAYGLLAAGFVDLVSNCAPGSSCMISQRRITTQKTFTTLRLHMVVVRWLPGVAWRLAG